MSIRKVKISSLKLEIKNKKSSLQEENVWLLNLDQIQSHTGKIISKELVPISKVGSSTHFFEKGTILYSKLRPYLNKVIIADDCGFATTELVPIVINSEIVDSNYLVYFLRSHQFLSFATNVVAGAKMPRMVMSEFWNYEIPLPPLEEQRRIAAILDQADALRQKRQQSLEKLDQLLQAAFIEMFGDPVSNPKGWDTMCIESLIAKEKYSLKRGPFGGALKKEIFVDSGYLVYEQYHALNSDFSFQRYFINEDKYQELKAFTVKPKDIIISCSGVNLGKLAEIPLGSPVGIINQALLKTRCAFRGIPFSVD